MIMGRLTQFARHLVAATVLLGASLATAEAAEVRVMISGGLSSAYKKLVPEFEKATGHKVLTAYGPSMGTTENAIPVRLARGEPVDVLIMVGYALGQLVEQGKVIPASRVDMVNSPIGVAVKSGSPKPDIATPEALSKALIAAKSVVYSDSASGVYVQNEMFKKLGIEEQMKGKARMVPAEPVAEVVARGEAEIGFQQMSELMAVHGVDVVGVIPDAVQKITVFSAGVSATSKEPDAGKALIQFLMAPANAPVIVKSGLFPIAFGAKK